jgi:hypothetical protein
VLAAVGGHFGAPYYLTRGPPQSGETA